MDPGNQCLAQSGGDSGQGNAGRVGGTVLPGRGDTVFPRPCRSSRRHEPTQAASRPAPPRPGSGRRQDHCQAGRKNSVASSCSRKMGETDPKRFLHHLRVKQCRERSHPGTVTQITADQINNKPKKRGQATLNNNIGSAAATNKLEVKAPCGYTSDMEKAMSTASRRCPAVDTTTQATQAEEIKGSGDRP